MRIGEASRERLHVVTESDGVTWARGRGYKARFGPGGATFVPFFGSAAPRNFPLELSILRASAGAEAVQLAPALAAVRAGEQITIDRGVVDEVYDLALDHIEQKFVIEERPGSGDFEIVIGVSEDFLVLPGDAGFELRGEHGSVRYGQAFALGSDGSRTLLEAGVVADGIRIRVAADLLDRSAYPLVIDPIIGTHGVAVHLADHFEADLSYDVTTDRKLIAYTEVFSVTDWDVRFGFFTPAGGTIGGDGYFDFTSEDWRNPQVANLNQADQFLCVAQVLTGVGSAASVIRGRTVAAATGVLGAKFNISSSSYLNNCTLPDIGGDPYAGAGASYYCVTWQYETSPTNADIHARLVDATSALVGPQTILVSSNTAASDVWPSISESNGQLGGSATWTIAWHRQITPSDYDIFAARIRYDGVQVGFATAIVDNTFLTYFPRVSSPLSDGRVCIVYARDAGLHHDLWAAVLNGLAVEYTTNLTALETPDTLSLDQLEYSVDSDGSRVAISYAESTVVDPTSYDVRVATFLPQATSMALIESHWAVDISPEHASRTDIVSEWGSGGGGQYFHLAWDEVVGGSSPVQRDIFSGEYAYLVGGAKVPTCPGDDPALCPCGNAGTTGKGCGNTSWPSGGFIVTSGVARTGAADTLTFVVAGMAANAPALLFQGTTGTAGIPFGDGRLCTGGTIVRLSVKFGTASGNATWPSGADGSLSTMGGVPLGGGIRNYQVYFRDAASFCTSDTFNLTSGMRVQWIP